jgi:light-regulated signal transduction histidine kinase (bacteriophytochrome)
MKYKIKLGLIGVAFGCMFPLIAVAVECMLFRKDCTLSIFFGRMFLESSFMYVILLAPFVLGPVFYYIGGLIDKLRAKNIKIELQNKRLRNANESLDLFNYHVSHDLKTVLNNVEALTIMANKHYNRGEVEKLTEVYVKLLKTTATGRKTVDGFLEFGKLNFDSNKEKVEELNVRSELTEIQKNFSLCDLNINIINTHFETITLSKIVFESVFGNLLTNSVKYSENVPKIEITLNWNGANKVVTYKDNGIGMDLKKHGDKLFKPFSRLPNDLKKEGTGIGMFLTKTLLENVGASLKVESEVGKGSIFTIEFES